MSANGKVDIAVLIEQHKPQLVSSGVPEHLWQTLFNKIINGVSSVKVSYVSYVGLCVFCILMSE